MKTLNLEQMENVNGGASFVSCVGGSALGFALFVTGAALATTMTAGAAGVAIVGWFSSIGLGCFA